MKLFNVTLEVSISEIGDADEIENKRSPLANEFTDGSALKDAAKLIDLLQERQLFPGATPMMIPSPFGGSHRPGDGMNMHHQFKVVVGSFAEMQELLAKFRAVADALSMPA